MVKAELHCHIEGAAEPVLVERLARKHSIDLGGIIVDGAYQWEDFTSFLNAYDRAATVFRSAEDYRLLAYDYFWRLAAQEAIYGEVFASPDHAATHGVDYRDLIEGIAAGIEDAKAETDIEGRILVTCVRHLGPQSAEAVARLTHSQPHPMVTGFGMAGDERAFEVEDFIPAFRIAADAGLQLTAHAGELRGAKTVADSVEKLGVTRIGHGVRAIEDAGVVDMLVEAGIVLEVCPGSNLALGIYPSMDAHPLRQLADAGVQITVNSDDPPFFHTDLTHEYELAASVLAPHQAGTTLTRRAIEAAFVDPATRRALLKRAESAA